MATTFSVVDGCQPFGYPGSHGCGENIFIKSYPLNEQDYQMLPFINFSSLVTNFLSKYRTLEMDSIQIYNYLVHISYNSQ